jgi:hypothetical protein
MAQAVFTAPKTTRSYRSKKVYVKTVDGQEVLVAEGSFFTRSPWEQWHGWHSNGGRRQRGLRDLLPDKMRDLLFDLGRAEALIDADLTYTSEWHGEEGEVTKLIDQYEEERLQEDLESLRDSINQTLETWNRRRPLKRRIELMREVTEQRGATPDEAANAKAMIDRLERRLEA